MSQRTNSTSISNSTLIDFLSLYGPHLAFVQALVATLGSLYFSEFADFVPCTLCWYQRILMYPLTIIILIGIIKQDGLLTIYVLPFSIIGVVVSSYHYLLQLQVFGHSPFCAVGVSCGLRYVNFGGFVTIPFMALIGFIIITVVMFATRWANNQLYFGDT